ncbi:MAG: hypothetical protein OEZ22_10630 [Spirochaetia bacterium]|nr:hypothetical protein [Spirochaetia bacterium]
MYKNILSLILLLFLVTPQAFSKEKKYLPKNYYFFIESEITEDEKFNLFLKVASELTKKLKVNIFIKKLESNLADSLLKELENINNEFEKIIIFTTASYPKKYENIYQREKYIQKLINLPSLFQKESFKYKIIFSQYKKSPLNYISKFSSIFSEYRILEEENLYDLLKLFDISIELKEQISLNLYDEPVEIKFENVKLKDTLCFDTKKYIKSNRKSSPLFIKRKKRDINFLIVTEKQKKQLILEPSQNICMFKLYSYGEKKNIYKIIFYNFVNPQIAAVPKVYLSRFPYKDKVVTKNIKINSNIILEEVQLLIETEKSIGKFPDFFSNNKKWIFNSKESIYFLPDLQDKPVSFILEKNEFDLSISYKGDWNSYYKGKIKIIRNNVVYHEIPIIINSSFFLHELLIFIQDHIYVTLIVSFLLFLFLSFLYGHKKDIKKRILNGLQGSFSILIRPHEKIYIAEKQNPFNCRLIYLGDGFQINYTIEEIKITQLNKVGAVKKIDDIIQKPLIYKINSFWNIELSIENFNNNVETQSRLVKLNLFSTNNKN